MPAAPILQDTAAAQQALRNGSDLRTVLLNDGSRVRLLSYRTSLAGAPPVLQVGRLLTDQDRVLSGFYTGLLILGGIAVVLLGFGSWWLSGRTLNPAQQAWEQQQIFISNASHELRTPLTLIRASTEYALRSPDTQKQNELLQNVLQDCDYMNRLVDDLLLLYRAWIHTGSNSKKPRSRSLTCWLTFQNSSAGWPKQRASRFPFLSHRALYGVTRLACAR